MNLTYLLIIFSEGTYKGTKETGRTQNDITEPS